MKLFFESGFQAGSFLAAVPIGLLAALCIDFNHCGGWVGVGLDILLVLLGAASLILMSLCFRENTLRIYHLLGLCIGALMYFGGIGRLFRMLNRHKK